MKILKLITAISLISVIHITYTLAPSSVQAAQDKIRDYIKQANELNKQAQDFKKELPRLSDNDAEKAYARHLKNQDDYFNHLIQFLKSEAIPKKCKKFGPQVEASTIQYVKEVSSAVSTEALKDSIETLGKCKIKIERKLARTGGSAAAQ